MDTMVAELQRRCKQNAEVEMQFTALAVPPVTTKNLSAISGESDNHGNVKNTATLIFRNYQ